MENGNISVGVSMSMGAVAYAHDIRKSIKHNVNTELIQDNVILVDEIADFKERWIQENKQKPKAEQAPRPKNDGAWMRAYLDQKMQPYMDEWNNKRRKDRRTDMTYTEWHEHQRKHSDNKKGDLFYEFVFQYGSGEDIGRRYYEVVEKLQADPHNQELIDQKQAIKKEFTDFYKKCMEDLQEKYGLTVLYATIHFDEGFREINGNKVCGTPHLHCCVSPITDPTQEKQRFAKGPSVQISMNKVMESHGIERIKSHSKEKLTAEQKQGYQLSRMCIQYRKKMEEAVMDLGYTIKEPQNSRPHMAPDMYYAAESERQRAEAERQKRLEIEAENQELTYENQELKLENHKLQAQSKALTQENQGLSQENEALNEEIMDLKAQIDQYGKEKRKGEAELEVLKIKTEAELQKERRALKKDHNNLPKRDLLGRPKEHNYPGGKYYEEFTVGAYNGLETRINNFSDGIKEIKKADIVGQEQIERLQELIDHEMDYIKQEVNKILAEDMERIQENARKSQELKEKELELVERESEITETIRDTAKSLLDKALSQGIQQNLAEFVQQCAPQVWEWFQAHQEKEKRLAEQYIDSARIDRGHGRSR